MTNPVPATLEPRRLIEFTSADAAAMLTACFEGYVVPFKLTAEAFERRNRSEHVDAEASLFWFRGGKPVGAILIARRGWTARVSAMAVMPEARGTGVGRAMMTHALAAASERGDRKLMLEVIEQNPAAKALYEAVGLHVVRRLVGYTRPAASAASGSAQLPVAAFEECDLLHAARFIGAEGEADLPWILAAETLSGFAPPVRAYRLDGAAAIANETPETVVLRGLAVARDRRRTGRGSALIEALAARYPGKPLKLVAVVPESLAPGFFRECGFQVDAITQFEMAARLDLPVRRT